MYIGQRVRELRKTHKMSLTELAEKSGVQIATLSRIENLKMTGTLDSHTSIAKALGVDITHLYAHIITKEDKVNLGASRPVMDMFVHSDKSSYEILTTKVISKKMMPILLKIEPGGQTRKEQNPPGSEKFVFVLEGKIDIHIGDKAYPLSKYNTLYFNASLEHYFMNARKVTARVLCVGTPVAL
jgi:transcriptional regulator with XRE-family HTH domain